MKPEAVFDNRPITPTELDRLHGELDYYDRQQSLEEIWDIVVEAKETDNPATWYERLQDIKQHVGEFIA